jgi:hypothetical protein
LHSISKMRKSTGTRLLLTIIRTSLILPKGFCRGDDFRGMPRAAQYAGWRPRNLHGVK